MRLTPAASAHSAPPSTTASAAAATIASSPSHSSSSPLELQVVEALNLARTKPSVFADRMETYRQYYDAAGVRSVPGRIPIRTNEGLRAFDEAIAALRAARPVAPLTVSR